MSRKTGLIDMFKDLGFKVGVEIGTDRGFYAKDICIRFPEVKLYTIDPFLPYTEGDSVKTQEDMEKIYEEAKYRLSFHKNCTIIRNTSMEAVKAFSPNSIDFVFIDGNHDFKHAYEDIREWTKIVKPGGIVSGHDYTEDSKRDYGVIEAVNKYVEENNIDPLYVLKRGGFRNSWYFRKAWL